MNVELCLKKNCDSVYLKEKTNKSIYNKRKILKKKHCLAIISGLLLNLSTPKIE